MAADNSPSQNGMIDDGDAVVDENSETGNGNGSERSKLVEVARGKETGFRE